MLRPRFDLSLLTVISISESLRYSFLLSLSCRAQQAKYILDAVLFVADHGVDFLPLYQPSISTAEWKYNVSQQPASVASPSSTTK